MFYENLLKLCEMKGVKLTNVLNDLGIGSGSMSRWKKGVKPQARILTTLSDYFGVSIDYLLDPDNEKAVQPHIMRESTAEAMEVFDKLSDSDRDFIFDIMKARLSKNQ